MEEPQVCIQMVCPPELRAQADMLAVQENPLNGGHIQDVDSVTCAALPIGTKWRNGRTLKVKILNGSEKIQSKIRQYARVWNKYSSVKFLFVDSGDAEIRVNVDGSGSSWSLLGTENLSRAAHLPTMNFGWLTDSTAEKEFSSVILHEFGHALGCIHEHNSPDHGISWNKPAVYEYYKRNSKLTKQEIDFNMFSLYSATTTQFSEFDTKSIMLYSFPASFTTNGFSTGWNTELSETDKRFIAEAYPLETLSLSYFSTTELRTSDQPEMKTSLRKLFRTTYSSPPSLAVGLYTLDIGAKANIRVKAYADSITRSSARVNIDTWSNTALYVGACTWFRAAANDPDFQVGQYSTDDGDRERPDGKTPYPISFPRKYKTPPTVVVWLNQIDMESDRNWRIVVSATNITNVGCTLNIDTWGDTYVHSAGVSWIAFPSNKRGVTSGTFSTEQIRHWDPATASTSGKLSFPNGTFRKTPTVFMALNNLDIPCGNNLRLKVSATSVSERGMDWNVDSWAGSLHHDAGAAYLAIDPDIYE